jgi:hypothetical protein
MQNDVKKMVVLMIISNVVLIQVLAENLIFGIFLVRKNISSFDFITFLKIILDQPRSRLMKYPILFKRIHKRV